MAALPSPRGVLFDWGNTLLREEGYDLRAGHRRLFELAGVEPSEADLDAYGARAEALRADMHPRRMESLIEFGADRMTRILAAEFGLEYEASSQELQLEFWRASATMSREPHLDVALDALVGRGLPLGIVSNYGFSAHVIRDELGRHGVTAPFAFVMSTNDYGFRKPHPFLFQTAARRLALAPGEIWFLGDSLAFDVHASQAVGMTGIWYNPRRAPAEGAAPDAVVERWDELPDLL